MKLRNHPLSLLLALSTIVCPALCRCAVFTTDTTIAANDLSFDGQDIIVTNCTLTVDGAHTFANIELQQGGVVTQPGMLAGSPTAVLLQLVVTGSVNVAVGSEINLDARGYPAMAGPGAGSRGGNPLSGSGASYGGLGGGSLGATPIATRVVYGNFTLPLELGSGGGDGALTGVGGSGGGRVSLQVSGTLLVEGRISANGGNSLGYRGGGGSGGSIYLKATTLAGSGRIQAKGGEGDPGQGGGGGGGRIALETQANLFTGALDASGGHGYEAGGPGSVYTKTTGQILGRLLFDNKGLFGSTIVPAGPIPCDLSIQGGTVVSSLGLLTLNNLTIGPNAWLKMSGAQLTISSNAVIEPGGGIDVDGLGHPAGQGPGAGRTGYLLSLYPGGGGGYGGCGGSAYASSAVGGQGYGIFTEPTERGSGGGLYYSQSQGSDGAGGGAVRMNVVGILICNGRISANGNPGGSTAGGGGSGGSIWLTVGTLAGGGVISAAGGAGQGWGDYSGGGGGGGRIAIDYRASFFMGSMMAHGGLGFVPGGAGTIYTRENYQNLALLLADNRGNSGTNTIWQGGSSKMDLIVRGGARFVVGYATLADVQVESNSCILASKTLNLTVNSNMIVFAGAAVLADELGSLGNSGPGRGTGNPGGSSGAGYGGYGGGLPRVPGGGTYGSITQAYDLGSGGGGYPSSVAGGTGGGGLSITVRGSLFLDGRLSANGGNATNALSGGGSGGYISLSASTFTGSGAVSASGGSGGANGGGGGGGRIIVSSYVDAFSGTISAIGGGGFSKGGAGTIYKGRGPSGYGGTVIVDNGGSPGAYTPLTYTSSLDVVIRSAGILVLPSITAIISLSIASDSWIVASNQTLTVSKNVLIEAGGGITANGNGYGPGLGTGAGKSYMVPNVGNVGGGAGFAGYGSEPGGGAHPALGGMPYGYSVSSPTELGSGGGVALYGGSGGGAVKLNVLGSLMLHGVITSEGRPGIVPGAGGGSGGSIQISAGALAGTGAISANGGAGNGLGGGGSGGRIALVVQTNVFAGLVTAFGGAGASGAGAAGTIYTSPAYPAAPRLLVDNGGRPGTNTIHLGNQSGWNVTIRNGAVLSPTSSLMNVRNLTVDDGGTLTFGVDSPKANLTVLDNVVVASNGVISVTGVGWPHNTGPGAGGTISGIGSGAGHGGVGGASSVGPGGIAYGYATQPIDPGSGGGMGYAWASAGSQGGGALRMIVGGSCTVNGRLSADGVSGLDDSWGGGSGGSIWLDADAVIGNGLIQANGGAGELYFGGGGAGGRIAIYTPMDFFSGNVSCAGGPGYKAGRDGTVLRLASPLPLEVIAYSPSGIVTQGVSEVVLSLNTPINLNSLSIEDVVLTTPTGVLSSSNLEFVVERLDLIRVKFPPQNTEGVYRLRFGPEVENLHSQPMAQAFNGVFAIAWPVVEGTVAMHTGEPVPGVLISATGAQGGVLTDALGRYRTAIPPAGFVCVAASKSSLCFAPARRSYTNQVCSLAAQNFIAMPETKVLASISAPGNLNLRWQGTAGLTYQALCSTNLVDWEPLDAPLNCINTGEMNLQVQTDSAPKRFFRIQISP